MIGEALRLIRVFHDKKLIQVAEELEISPGYLSEIERGKANKKPSIELLEKYAEVFNTKPSVIMFFAEELDKEKSRNPIKVKLRNKIITFLKLLEDETN